MVPGKSKEGKSSEHSNWHETDCFRTYFTHVQTCNVTSAQSATEWTASGTFTHVQTCNVIRVQSATECML